MGTEYILHGSSIKNLDGGRGFMYRTDHMNLMAILIITGVLAKAITTNAKVLGF